MYKILLPLFVICAHLSFSQQDYLKIKDTICPAVCGIRDSSEIARIYSVLLNLDTTKITSGMAMYYYDLSYFQSDLAMRNNDDSTLTRLQLQSTEKGLFHDPTDYGMIWNAALIHAGFRECDKTHYYLTRYYEVCPKKYWKEKAKKEQIRILLMFCPNEELKKKFGIQ